MKCTLAIIISVVALLLAGCSIFPKKGVGSEHAPMQVILDKYISKTFTGDIDFQENIPVYITIHIRGTNLRREQDGWKYDWVEYTRNGPFGTSARLFAGKRS